MFGAIFSGKSAPEIVVWRPLHFVSAPNPHPLPSSVVREDEPLLVASARAGDAAAFEELVARYEDKIFRLTSNITGNREDAEDAMQDAFLKAYAHLNNFHGESRFYTWLVRIAANEALMRLRKRRPPRHRLRRPRPPRRPTKPELPIKIGKGPSGAIRAAFSFPAGACCVSPEALSPLILSRG